MVFMAWFKKRKKKLFLCDINEDLFIYFVFLGVFCFCLSCLLIFCFEKRTKILTIKPRFLSSIFFSLSSFFFFLKIIKKKLVEDGK
jgi:hypothetical protein